MLGGLLAVGAEPKAAVKPKFPVGGGAIDKSVSADYKGKKVDFCCAKCVKTFEDDTASKAPTSGSGTKAPTSGSGTK